MKTSAVIDRELLEKCIAEVEVNGPLASQSVLWQKSADLYNQRLPDGGSPISHTVVYLRAKEWNTTTLTPKGMKGRSGPMTDDQKAKMKEARQNAPHKSKAEKLSHVGGADEHIERLRKHTPKQFHPLIDKLSKGSRSAAMKLMCLQCVGFERIGVRECGGKSCPMFLYRPYQHTDVDEDVVDQEETQDKVG